MTNYDKVKAFHDKFGLKGSLVVKLANDTSQLMRVRLMNEELSEVVEAMTKKNIVELAKELADLLYVVYGTADYNGIPIDEVFNAVHESNMSKSEKRDVGGKIEKGDNYIEPDIAAIIRGDT